MAFRSGFKIPCSNIAQKLLTHLNITPGQLAPFSWRLLLCLEVFEKEHGCPVKLEDLFHIYTVRTQTQGRFGFRSRDKERDLFMNLDASCSDWQDKFLFIKKDSLGGLADFIPDQMNTRVVQLGSGDASKPNTESLARLQKIWDMDLELRTFPACVEKFLLPSFHAFKEGAAIRPISMLPPLPKTSTSTGTNVSSRTRTKVDLELIQSIAKTPDQKKSRMPPNLKDIIDLTVQQATSSVQPEQPKEPTILPTEAETMPSSSKKRKADQLSEDEMEEFDNALLGAGLIADFAKERQNKRIRHRSADLLRVGLGEAYDSFKALVAGAYMHDKEIEKMKSDYQVSKDREAKAVLALKEKDDQIIDLITRAVDSEARVTELSAEVDKLQHQLEEAKENVQHTARYCLLLGRINAMKEPVEARATWDVKAAEDQISGMIGEQSEVSSKAADQPQSPTPSQTLFSDQCSQFPLLQQIQEPDFLFICIKEFSF